VFGTRADSFDDTDRLGAEIDVAGAWERRLFRALRYNQLYRALSPRQQLADAGLVLRPEDRHLDGL